MIKSCRRRHTAKPGLSGLAQINGRNAITWEDKLGWDLKYIQKITFLGDIRIIFKTVGLKECRNEFVARMDTDDISKPDRCEKQLKKFDENPELSLVGAYVDEFYSSPDEVVSTRKVPTEHKNRREKHRSDANAGINITFFIFK